MKILPEGTTFVGVQAVESKLATGETYTKNIGAIVRIDD